MPDEVKLPHRSFQWDNIAFFIGIILFGIFGSAFYIARNGVALSEFLLFAFFMMATPLSITVGYHRLFSHRSYSAHPVIQFILLFFGAAALQQSALKWSAQHRTHHLYVDTDYDPYSIKKGFWYAHIDWLISWSQHTDYSNVPDLKQNALVMNQHRYFVLWAITAGILTPLLIGALTGHLLGAFLFSVCARLTIVYNSTFCINSVCHMFGKATYDIYSSAKDHWFAAVLTYGEGYHNYHHHFPIDYRNGVRWYHWDPTKWCIALMARVGLATDLKKISKQKILSARLRAKHQLAEDTFKALPAHPKLETLREKLKLQYEQLKSTLSDWEHHAHVYRSSIGKQISESEFVSEARTQLKTAEKQFKEAFREWNELYSKVPSISK